MASIVVKPSEQAIQASLLDSPDFFMEVEPAADGAANAQDEYQNIFDDLLLEDPTLLLFEASNKYNCTGVPLYQWNLSHVPYTSWHHQGSEISTQNNQQQDISACFIERLIQFVIHFLAPEASVKDINTALVIAVYAIVSLVSIVGNALILGSAAAGRKKTRKNKSPLFVYQCNLAVAGMIVATYCIWSHVFSNHLGGSIPAILAPIMCRWNGFVHAMTLVASTLTLVAIAVDRFVAIVFPFWTKRQSRGRLFWSILIFGIWFTAASVSAPFAIFRQMVVIKWRDHEEFVCEDTWPQELLYVVSRSTEDPEGSGETWCKLDHYWRRIYYTIIPIVMYFLPLALMAMCYAMIVVEVWRATGGSNNSGPQSLAPQMSAKARSRRTTDRTKTAKTAVAALAAFAFSWTPLQIFILHSLWVNNPGNGEGQSNLNGAADGSMGSKHWNFEMVAYLMAYSHSAVHPFLYGKLRESAEECFRPLTNAMEPLVNFCRNAKNRVHRSSFSQIRIANGLGSAGRSSTAGTNAVVLYSGNITRIVQTKGGGRVSSLTHIAADPGRIAV